MSKILLKQVYVRKTILLQIKKHTLFLKILPSNVKCKTIIFLEDNIGESLDDLEYATKLFTN